MTLRELFVRENCSDEEKRELYKYLLVIRFMENIEEVRRLTFLLNKSLFK